MLDEDKNAGVVQVWGDLYRNPLYLWIYAGATAASVGENKRY